MQRMSMLRSKKYLLVVFFVGICWDSQNTSGQGPIIDESNAVGRWMSAANPMNWQLPGSERSTSRSAGTKAKASKKNQEPGLFSGMSQSVSRGWSRTKQTLSPSRWMPGSGDSGKSAKNHRNARDSDGGWASWFAAKEEPQKIETVGDFLRLPMPR